MEIMLDVAGGIIIAAVSIGFFIFGAAMVLHQNAMNEHPLGWLGGISMLGGVAIGAWIVFFRH